MKPEVVVHPVTSILIMFTTVFAVLASGALLAVFSTQYESSCTPDSTGKSICTQTVKFKGWEALPLQALPGAIGTGLGIYAAVKSGKLPGMNAPPNAKSVGWNPPSDELRQEEGIDVRG